MGHLGTSGEGGGTSEAEVSEQGSGAPFAHANARCEQHPASATRGGSTGVQGPRNHTSFPLEALFVGDHPEADAVREHLARNRDFCLHLSDCGDSALQALTEGRFDIVFLCACRPGRSGLRVLAEGRHLQPGTPFIVLTEDHSPQTAVAAMQLGAYDYLLWPVDSELLALQLERARRHVLLNRNLDRLERERAAMGCCGMVGLSTRMRQVYDLVHHVAATSTTVLIVGETGTGKELVARALHGSSPRHLKPFVPINCAAVPEALLESELFGHVRGSFTGAVSTRQGLIPAAADGTVFLDDVEALPLPMQGKLLRALEERRVQPVGGRQEVSVDFRLVAATNVDLEQMVQAGEFREDLFYRLSVFPIELPPLRERREDIPALVSYFSGIVARDLEMDPPLIDEQTLNDLAAYDWPGNARELRNWVERAVILARVTGVISLSAPKPANGGRPPSLYEHARQGWSLEQLTEEYIRTVLEHTGGHRTRAAEILGIDRRTVYRKIPAARRALRISQTRPTTS